MNRGRGSAVLSGALIVLALGGGAAHAGTEPEPAPSTVPDTDTLPPAMFAVSVLLPDDVDPADVTVGVTLRDAPGPEYVIAPATCAAVPQCAVFDLPPGSYDLVFTIVDPPGVARFFLLDDEPGFVFGVDVVDSDLVVQLGIGAVAAPPTTSTTTTTTEPVVTTTVASGGPVPVDELPATGSTGRLGQFSAALVALGLGCLAVARRRPV